MREEVLIYTIIQGTDYFNLYQLNWYPQHQMEAIETQAKSTAYHHVFTMYPLVISYSTMEHNNSGWWFQPLYKILVKWDYCNCSQYMEK